MESIYTPMPKHRTEDFDCSIIMVAVTRAQTRTKCYEIAMNTPVRTAVRIWNTRTLLQYAESCMLKPDIGTAVIELEVAFSENTPFSLLTLRKCLQLMPNINDLILRLPSCSPRVTLSGLRFPSLQLVESNLLHRVMVPFIEQHPTINYLLLGPCEGGRRCPLHATSLDNVTDLRLPLGCLSDLANPSISRLHAFLTDQILSSSTILRTLRSYSSLYSLTVEFRNDDYDILCGISGLAPTLRKLRLLVQPSFQRRERQSRRAWNNTVIWARDLRRLQRLEELLIQVDNALVNNPRAEDEEEMLIYKWLSGRSCPTDDWTGSHIHPTLYHIGIWYYEVSYVSSIVSDWWKDVPRWCRRYQYEGQMSQDQFI
ncbi:hypothetical protein NM688_g641 [Phlebia brevispora]|uniref:Uncharacterized protein n=1 Tax=Phlebia brevispora TaxID=194682 RepID=A0ACC1TDS7_9APHY|nr:hypothetical protein NM688_g641 [Phlebia brevispora]